MRRFVVDHLLRYEAGGCGRVCSVERRRQRPLRQGGDDGPTREHSDAVTISELVNERQALHHPALDQPSVTAISGQTTASEPGPNDDSPATKQLPFPLYTGTHETIGRA